MLYARAVVLVGSRSELPPQADASTILMAFTIRRYLKRHASQVQNRARPLYVVAEILDAENEEHARTAGADEVIQTTRMGYSLLAHAVEVPGTATLVGELADVSGNSVYVGALPQRLQGGSQLPVGRRRAQSPVWCADDRGSRRGWSGSAQSPRCLRTGDRRCGDLHQRISQVAKPPSPWMRSAQGVHIRSGLQ